MSSLVPARIREESKAETRDALVRAAAAEFSERGLDAPSLDAICARAGFTRGAFYVHFRDREDLVAAVMERALGAFFDAIIAGGGADDLERSVRRFEDAVVGIARLRGERRARARVPGVPFYRVLEACDRSEDLRERFVALLGEAARRVAEATAAGQRAGKVRDDVAPATLAALLVTLALGYVVELEAGMPIDAAAARRALLALVAA
jgi:AcrR family transcriptional regulator